MDRPVARSSWEAESRRVNTNAPRNRQRNEALSRVPCRFYNSSTGCWRGKDCWFMHERPASNSATSATPSVTGTEMSDMMRSETSTANTSPHLPGRDMVDTTCGICLEVPTKFGLMVNCSHVFCLACIRTWRNKEDKPDDTMAEGVHKTCPTCRKHSDYIVPSKKFHLHGTPEKEAEQRKYLATTAKIPCKFFSPSSPSSRYCPFGNDCHYSHQVNGRRYVFTQRQLEQFKENREYRTRQRQREAMLEGLLASEGALGMDENERFMWDLLSGLIEHEEEIYGHYGSIFDDLTYYDGEGFHYASDDEDEDYLESEDEDDEEDDNDEEEDDLPDLVDDDLPPLVDDSDGIPDLVSDNEHSQPDAWTREDWGPTDAQNDDSTNRPQIHLNGHRPQTHGSRQTARRSTPPVITTRVNPRPQVSHSMFRAPESQLFLPANPPHRTSSSGVSPRHRRFSPPQHTPPPGPRRPRPPRSRQRDTSRPRPAPRGGNRQTIIHDEITWDDEDGTTETDGEISEREKQRIRESEERGINARNWVSRSSDLSFFR